MAFPPVTTFTPTGTEVVSTAGGTEIAPARPKRFYLLILNMGSVAVYIRLDGGVPVADKTALRLLPGESYEPLNFLPSSNIMAIAASGTCEVHVEDGGSP